MPSASLPSLVAFDLDGTLTVRDSFRPYLARVCGRLAAERALAAAPSRTLGALAARSRDRLKEVVVAGTLAGRDHEELTTQGTLFAADVCSSMLRPDTVRRLRSHQEAGHLTIIVTASLGVYAREIGRILGADAVVATELETDRHGRCTGSLRGGNCRGPAKVDRIRAWAVEQNLRGIELLAAYGDSGGDSEMLAVARSGHRVRRRELSADFRRP